MAKTALITGITGQDGSYLAEFLLEKGYRVVGMTRRSSTDSSERIEHLSGRLVLIQGDLLDQASLSTAMLAPSFRSSTVKERPIVRPETSTSAWSGRSAGRQVMRT